jgi:hypothetical protein
MTVGMTGTDDIVHSALSLKRADLRRHQIEAPKATRGSSKVQLKGFEEPIYAQCMMVLSLWGWEHEITVE